MAKLTGEGSQGLQVEYVRHSVQFLSVIIHITTFQ